MRFIKITIFTVLSVFYSAASWGADLLVIESIKCQKPAGGIDGASTAGFGALGAIVAGGATVVAGGAVVVGSGGTAIGTVPVTAAATAKAAAGGAGTAVSAVKLLDGQFSGQDDLIVNVNGQKVLPTTGNFQKMEQNQVIKPNLKVSFDKTATISLIEYDSGSDNDDLGSITVHSNAFDIVTPGKDYRVEDAIVLAPREEDGSVYYVTYHVERNKGQKANVVEYMLCGTNACMACPNATCNVSYSGKLDRDKDKEDLKKCPAGFDHQSWKKYPQTWPAADVYLQACKKA